MMIWNTQAPVGELGLGKDLCIRDANGRVLCCIALAVTLYIEAGDRPEVREGLVRALARFHEVSGQPLTWGMNPISEEPEPVGGGGAVSFVQSWPTDVFERFDFQMIFTGGKTPDDASPLRFVAVSREREARQLSFLSLSLPVSWAASHAPEEFAAFVLELCNLVGPTHGYAGLAAIAHVTGFDGESVKPLFDLARRFQGLDLDLPDSHEPFLSSRDGIKIVNWLTVLGSPWIARLGGASAVQPRLGPGVRVSQYREGVVFQAGMSPQLGDVRGTESLENYRNVGAVLAPVRVKTGMMMRVDSGGGGFDLAEAERWQSRFDS